MTASACSKMGRHLVLLVAYLVPLTCGAPRPGVVYLALHPALMPFQYHMPVQQHVVPLQHHFVHHVQPLIVTHHSPVYVYYPPEEVKPTTETSASFRRVNSATSPTVEVGLRQAPPTPTPPRAGPIRLFFLFSRFPWPLESFIQRVQSYFSTYNMPQVEPLLVEEIDLAPAEPGHVDQDQLDPENPAKPAEPEYEEPIKPADPNSQGAVVADPLDPEQEEEPEVVSDLKPEIVDVEPEIESATEPELQEVKSKNTKGVVFTALG